MMDGFGSFLSGLVRGYGETTLGLEDERHREEMDRRRTRVNIIMEAIPHILDPELRAEAFTLAQEFATGKSGRKKGGGLADFLGPLIGRGSRGDVGHEEKFSEFMGRPREVVSKQRVPSAQVRFPDIPRSPEAVPPPEVIPPVPGTAAAGRTLTLVKKETVKGPFPSKEELLNLSLQDIRAKTEERMKAEEPFRRREAALEQDQRLALSRAQEEDRRQTRIAVEEARLENTTKPVVALREGSADPLDMVVQEVNGLGEVVSEREAEFSDLPAQMQKDLQLGLGTRRAGETASQAYTRILANQQRAREVREEGAELSQQEQKQRIAARARLEEIRRKMASGAITTPAQARLALADIRREARMRAEIPNDPDSYKVAYNEVLQEYGMTDEHLQRLRDLSVGGQVRQKLTPAGQKYLEKYGGTVR